MLARWPERDMVGNYELVDSLGEGGMARLYLGRHTRDGHEAAIKILHDEMAEDESLRKRFVNEARAIASITHPSVVELYEFGRTDDGNIYLAMEYIRGETLEDRLKATPELPIPLALSIADQIAGALSAAHELGITHRDLKPSNIMLLEEQGTVRAKLLDFGIAKFLHRTSFDSNLTKTGIIVGTPKYMAPEQCTGASDIDHRADIYSLGVILFRMLTGRVPFSGRGPAEVIALHLHGTPKSLRVYKPHLSMELDALVMLCLAKKPGERFQQVSELRDALHREMSSRVGRPGWDEVSEESPFDVAPTSVAQPAMRYLLGLDAAKSRIPAKPVAPVTATESALPGHETIAHTPSSRRSRPGGSGPRRMVSAPVMPRPGHGSDKIPATPAPGYGSDKMRVTPATPGYGSDRIRVVPPTPGHGHARLRAATPGFDSGRIPVGATQLDTTLRDTPSPSIQSSEAPIALPPEELDYLLDSQSGDLDPAEHSVASAVEQTANTSAHRRRIPWLLLALLLVATFALSAWHEPVLVFMDDARAMAEGYITGEEAEKPDTEDPTTSHENGAGDGLDQDLQVVAQPEPGATNAVRQGAATVMVPAESASNDVADEVAPEVAGEVAAGVPTTEPGSDVLTAGGELAMSDDPSTSDNPATSNESAGSDDSVDRSATSAKDDDAKARRERTAERRTRKSRRKKRARARGKKTATSVDGGSQEAKPIPSRTRPSRSADDVPVF